MVKVILLTVALALSGCAATKPPAPVYITAPAAKPPVIARPALDSEKINDKSSDSQVIQHLTSTVAQLIKYSRQLETALDAYK